MFNLLHALPAYNPILITAVDLLISTGIQLHLFHVPCNYNKVADVLSRLDVASACLIQPGLVVTKFSPPRLTLGEAVKLGIRMEMSGPKSCEVLASTCRLRRSLAGCLEFQRSRRSRRVWSRAEKKLKKTRAS